jgi:ATP-dependent protease ClpP protease subunit
MHSALQLFFLLYLSQASAFETLLESEFESKAYIDAESQTKTILFKKSFESLRSDGRSDLDFFKAAVQSLQLSPGDQLQIILQSDGGEISVGLNIHAFLLWLREKGVSITTQIPSGGFCHSICIPVFAAGNQRFAAPEASLIVHPPYYPGISDPQEKAAAHLEAKANYIKAIETADPIFAKHLDEAGFLDQAEHEFFANNLAQEFPNFLRLFGQCGDSQVSVLYADPIDYDLTCKALGTIRSLVQKELFYQTDAPIFIEFKETVLFSLFDPSGHEVSQEPVYGLYDRNKNQIAMSAYQSSIVQNYDREHFSVKIQSLPLSEETKKNLLFELHQSVVVHELTHLFTQHNFQDERPSPAIHEYFSYVIQLKSLSQDMLNRILDLNPSVFTHDLQINSMIHYANPHQFGVMSYKHFETLGEGKKRFIEDALSGRFRPDDLLEFL